MWMRRPGDIKPDGLPARALHAHFLCNAGAGGVVLLHKRGERVQAQTTRQFRHGMIDHGKNTLGREAMAFKIRRDPPRAFGLEAQAASDAQHIEPADKATIIKKREPSPGGARSIAPAAEIKLAQEERVLVLTLAHEARGPEQTLTSHTNHADKGGAVGASPGPDDETIRAKVIRRLDADGSCGGSSARHPGLDVQARTVRLRTDVVGGDHTSLQQAHPPPPRLMPRATRVRSVSVVRARDFTPVWSKPASDRFGGSTEFDESCATAVGSTGCVQYTGPCSSSTPNPRGESEMARMTQMTRKLHAVLLLALPVALACHNAVARDLTFTY